MYFAIYCKLTHSSAYIRSEHGQNQYQTKNPIFTT